MKLPRMASTIAWTAATAAFFCTSRSAEAEEQFADTVGAVRIEAVKAAGPVETPFITWGGDVATFHANGGLTTKPGSIFQKQGLDLKLVAGDNFVEQVKRYLSGKSPFL